MTTDLVRFENNTVHDPAPPRSGTTTATKDRPARTAADVMTQFPVTVDQRTSLFAAWGKLRGARARHLVVIDEGMRPIGVLDERDIALEWPPGPLAAQHLPVHQLLRFRGRPRVLGGDGIAAVARTMLGARTDAVPVVARDGRLLGLVTAQHCVELVAQDDGLPQAGAGARRPR